jgi:histidinol phosphatase-like enzyme
MPLYSALWYRYKIKIVVQYNQQVIGTGMFAGAEARRDSYKHLGLNHSL